MENVSEVAKTFFRGVWDLLIHTNFPGSNISLAAVFVALFLMSFSIRLFAFLTGFGLNGAQYGKSADAIEKIRSANQRQNHSKK